MLLGWVVGLGGWVQLKQPPEEETVSVRFQLVIDCFDPDRLARFWAAALGYELAPAEATRLSALGATITGAFPDEGLDHYAVGMNDPEGNEFDIN